MLLKSGTEGHQGLRFWVKGLVPESGLANILAQMHSEGMPLINHYQTSLQTLVKVLWEFRVWLRLYLAGKWGQRALQLRR